MQPSPPPLPASPEPQCKTAGLAIASLVLGIFSLFCGMFITGIPAIILGIIALVRIGKTPGLRGTGLAVAGLITGSIGTAVTPIIAAIMLPALMMAREKAREAVCINEVGMLCRASIAFENEHANTLPKTLEDLKPFLGGDSKQIDRNTHCPMDRDAAEPSYRIEHAGEKTTDLPITTTPIIVEKECRHHGKRTVGYLDGHVELRVGP